MGKQARGQRVPTSTPRGAIYREEEEVAVYIYSIAGVEYYKKVPKIYKQAPGAYKQVPEPHKQALKSQFWASFVHRGVLTPCKSMAHP